MAELDAARTPVIVGIGQAIERSVIVTSSGIAARAALAALDDAPGMDSKLDRVTMVSVIFSPSSPRAGSEVVEQLGLEDVPADVTTVGGNTPQWMVTQAAKEIAAGELNAALITGGEATRSLRAGDPKADFMGAGRRGAQPDVQADPVRGPQASGMLSRAEVAAGLTRPTDVYPIFESAMAAAAGRNPAAQRAFIGELFAPFTQVAAGHPFAWFQKALTPSEIAEPSDDNRLTAEPYTKRMNAFPNVDQGAAMIVTSLAVAREVGLEDQCVFIWGGASNADVVPSARAELGGSPAIRAAGKALFEATGVGIDDVDYIDLYSCFPSAVEAGAAAIGLATNDSRGLTLTGGLPFFGGPGNNYTAHGICTAVEKLRQSQGKAYVAANGGFLSKHALAIYGSSPPPRGFAGPDTRAAQEHIDAAALPVAKEGAEGEATVKGGTVVYARDGAVASAPVIAQLDDGRRVVASAKPEALKDLAGRSLVGERVRIEGSPPTWS